MGCSGPPGRPNAPPFSTGRQPPFPAPLDQEWSTNAPPELFNRDGSPIDEPHRVPSSALPWSAVLPLMAESLPGLPEIVPYHGEGLGDG